MPNMIESQSGDLRLALLPAYVQRASRSVLNGFDFADLEDGKVLAEVGKQLGSRLVLVQLVLRGEQDVVLREVGTDRLVTRWCQQALDSADLALFRCFGTEPFSLRGDRLAFEVRNHCWLEYQATIDGVLISGFDPIETERPTLDRIHGMWVDLVRGMKLAQ